MAFSQEKKNNNKLLKMFVIKTFEHLKKASLTLSPPFRV